MKLKPLHDWAVIIPAEAAAMTAGGLYIPDSAQQKPEEGVVEAIGPGALEEEKTGRKKTDRERKFIPTTVKPGDRVLFERWSGQTYKIGTEDRILVRERNVLGLIDRPLQIPQATSSGSATAIIPRVVAVPARPSEKLMKTPVKPKTTKQAAPKKKAAKKTPAKPAKKAAKKTAKKIVKTATAKKKSSKPAAGKKAKKKK